MRCAGKNGTCSRCPRFSVLKTMYCGHHARQAVQRVIGALVRGYHDHPERLDQALGITLIDLFGKPAHASGGPTLGLLGKWWASLDDGEHDLTLMACIIGHEMAERKRRRNNEVAA